MIMIKINDLKQISLIIELRKASFSEITEVSRYLFAAELDNRPVDRISPPLLAMSHGHITDTL